MPLHALLFSCMLGSKRMCKCVSEHWCALPGRKAVLPVLTSMLYEWAQLCLAWQKGNFISFNYWYEWAPVRLIWQKDHFICFIQVCRDGWVPCTWPGKKAILWMNDANVSDVMNIYGNSRLRYYTKIACIICWCWREIPTYEFLPIMRQWITSLVRHHSTNVNRCAKTLIFVLFYKTWCRKS